MRQAAVSLLLLCGSIASIAQVNGQGRPQSLSRDQALQLALGSPGKSRACPVDLRAQQAGVADLVQADAGKPDGSKPKGIAQRLRLMIVGPESARIVAAKVTVRGYSRRGRIRQTFTTDDGSADASRTLQVNFSSGHETGSAFLWAHGLTAVESVDLLSLTYNDGSIWNIAEGNVCRIIPDPVMLIAND